MALLRFHVRFMITIVGRDVILISGEEKTKTHTERLRRFSVSASGVKVTVKVGSTREGLIKGNGAEWKLDRQQQQQQRC